MANELKFTYDGAGTVTGTVSSPLGIDNGEGSIAMSEVGTSNVFLGDAGVSDISYGDIIQYYIDGVLNDSEVYAPVIVNDFDPANDDVALVTLVTENTDMRGTDGANTTVPDAAGVAPTAAEIVTALLADASWNAGSKTFGAGFNTLLAMLVGKSSISGTTVTCKDIGDDVTTILTYVVATSGDFRTPTIV